MLRKERLPGLLASLFITLFYSFSTYPQVISTGVLATFSLCNDSTVRGWGYNSGLLGDSTNIDHYTPVQVFGLTGVKSIVSGDHHTFALKNDGTAWGWGQNNAGQLCDSGTILPGTLIPTQITRLTGIITITGGIQFTLAVKGDSTVWACGLNGSGQLGDSTFISKNYPVQVNCLTGIALVAAGLTHSIALKNDGTVWAWGSNAHYQLGDGTSILGRPYPGQVNGVTGIIAVACGTEHSLALKNDGTVWAWGWNGYGQLGDSSNIDKNIPVQVNGLSGIIDIACGGAYSLALKNDGTVWTWGYNHNGQLGDGTTNYRIVPVQAGITGTVIALGKGCFASHTVVLKSDGTVWSWGNNTYGQLGDGNSGIPAVTYPVLVTGLCTMPTSMNEVPEEESAVVYPNPTAGVFHFQFGNKEDAIKNITITDVTGRIIFFTNQNKNEVDLSFAAAGIYFYSVVTKEGNVFKGKLVKE